MIIILGYLFLSWYHLLLFFGDDMSAMILCLCYFEIMYQQCYFTRICTAISTGAYIESILINLPEVISAGSSYTVSLSSYSEGQCVRYLETEKLIPDTPFLFPSPVICTEISPIFFNIIVVLFDNVINPRFFITLPHHLDGIWKGLTKSTMWWIIIKIYCYILWVKQKLITVGSKISISIYSKNYTV